MVKFVFWSRMGIRFSAVFGLMGFVATCEMSANDEPSGDVAVDVGGSLKSDITLQDDASDESWSQETLCPTELLGCYENFPNGGECENGSMLVLFWESPADEAQSRLVGKCVIYYPTPIHCCNGYIANKSAFLSTLPIGCVEEGLTPPPSDDNVDEYGVYDPGLLVDPSIGDAIVCAGYQLDHITDGLVQFFPGTLLQVAEGMLVKCGYDNPLSTTSTEVEAAPWGGGLNGEWKDKHGSDCFDIDGSYH